MTFDARENYWINLARELAQVQAAQVERDIASERDDERADSVAIH